MTIIRRKVSRNYTIITNNCFDDQSLSGELLGLLTYLLSRPDNWQIRPQPLARRMRWGRDKTYNALSALADLGYIERRQLRDGINGKFKEFEYVVYDERVAGLSVERRPLTEMPLPENQKAAKRINTESQKILPPKPPSGALADLQSGSPTEEGHPSPRSAPALSITSKLDGVGRPWAKQGEFEGQLAALLGKDGLDILSSIPEWKLTRLCRDQSRGAVIPEQLETMKSEYLLQRARSITEGATDRPPKGFQTRT